MAVTTLSLGGIRESAAGRYRKLAESSAAGEPLNPAQVHSALSGCGRTLDELEQDSERLRSRRKALADIERAGKLKASAADYSRQSSEKAAEARQILEEAEARAKPIQLEAARLEASATGHGQQARYLTREAKETLLRTAGPESTERLTGLRQQIEQARQQLQRLREQQNRNIGLRSEERAGELAERVQSAATRVSELELSLSAAESDLHRSAVSW